MPRKAKTAADRMYFTEETEDAIVKYNNTDDELERELIYKKYLDYPIDKMAQSIINTFKFPYVDTTFEETKQQVISFIVLNLYRYSKDKGKAFSYFSVIAKNYLILHNTNAFKLKKKTISWPGDISTSADGTSSASLGETLDLEQTDIEQEAEATEFMELILEYWETNVNKMFKKQRDVKIANAILELFRRAEYIENYNKKAIYLMIREQTDIKTTYITKVLNKMYDHLLVQRENYSNTGLLTYIDPKTLKQNERT